MLQTHRYLRTMRFLVWKSECKSFGGKLFLRRAIKLLAQQPRRSPAFSESARGWRQYFQITTCFGGEHAKFDGWKTSAICFAEAGGVEQSKRLQPFGASDSFAVAPENLISHAEISREMVKYFTLSPFYTNFYARVRALWCRIKFNRLSPASVRLAAEWKWACFATLSARAHRLGK